MFQSTESGNVAFWIGTIAKSKRIHVNNTFCTPGNINHAFFLQIPNLDSTYTYRWKFVIIFCDLIFGFWVIIMCPYYIGCQDAVKKFFTFILVAWQLSASEVFIFAFQMQRFQLAQTFGYWRTLITWSTCSCEAPGFTLTSLWVIHRLSLISSSTLLM